MRLVQEGAQTKPVLEHVAVDMPGGFQVGDDSQMSAEIGTRHDEMAQLIGSKTEATLILKPMANAAQSPVSADAAAASGCITARSPRGKSMVSSLDGQAISVQPSARLSVDSTSKLPKTRKAVSPPPPHTESPAARPRTPPGSPPVRASLRVSEQRAGDESVGNHSDQGHTLYDDGLNAKSAHHASNDSAKARQGNRCLESYDSQLVPTKSRLQHMSSIKLLKKNLHKKVEEVRKNLVHDVNWIVALTDAKIWHDVFVIVLGALVAHVLFLVLMFSNPGPLVAIGVSGSIVLILYMWRYLRANRVVSPPRLGNNMVIIDTARANRNDSFYDPSTLTGEFDGALHRNIDFDVKCWPFTRVVKVKPEPKNPCRSSSSPGEIIKWYFKNDGRPLGLKFKYGHSRDDLCGHQGLVVKSIDRNSQAKAHNIVREGMVLRYAQGESVASRSFSNACKLVKDAAREDNVRLIFTDDEVYVQRDWRFWREYPVRAFHHRGDYVDTAFCNDKFDEDSESEGGASKGDPVRWKQSEVLESGANPKVKSLDVPVGGDDGIIIQDYDFVRRSASVGGRGRLPSEGLAKPIEKKQKEWNRWKEQVAAAEGTKLQAELVNINLNTVRRCKQRLDQLNPQHAKQIDEIVKSAEKALKEAKEHVNTARDSAKNAGALKKAMKKAVVVNERSCCCCSKVAVNVRMAAADVAHAAADVAADLAHAMQTFEARLKHAREAVKEIEMKLNGEHKNVYSYAEEAMKAVDNYRNKLRALTIDEKNTYEENQARVETMKKKFYLHYPKDSRYVNMVAKYTLFMPIVAVWMPLVIMQAPSFFGGPRYAGGFGSFLFLGMLLASGLHYGNWLKEKIPALDKADKQLRLPVMPYNAFLWVKLISVGYECFMLCGFAYLPSLPWADLFPPDAPQPQLWFQVGILEFDYKQQAMLVYYSSCFFIMLALVCWYATKNSMEYHMIAIQFCYDTASYAVLKTQLAVFACTGVDVMILDKRANHTSTQFCITDGWPPHQNGLPEETRMCMDSDPTTECFGRPHMWFLVPAMTVFLVPYYLMAMHLITAVQAKQSVACINTLDTLLTFQIKFVMAVMVSYFGECYPILILISCACLIIMLAVTEIRYGYSNVLLLNVVRACGLCMALVNVSFALTFALMQGASPCEQNNSAVGDISMKLDSSHSKTSYTAFIILGVANILIVVIGVCIFKTKRRYWGDDEEDTSTRNVERQEMSKIETLKSAAAASNDYNINIREAATKVVSMKSNDPHDEKDVHFLILRSKVIAMCRDHRSTTHARQVLNLILGDADKVRQIEDTSLEMLLHSRHLPPTIDAKSKIGIHVHLTGINPEDDGSVRLMQFFEKVYFKTSARFEKGISGWFSRRYRSIYTGQGHTEVLNRVTIQFADLKDVSDAYVSTLSRWILYAMWSCERVDISKINSKLATKVKKRLTRDLNRNSSDPNAIKPFEHFREIEKEMQERMQVKDYTDTTIRLKRFCIEFRIEDQHGDKGFSEKVVALRPWVDTIDFHDTGFHSLDMKLLAAWWSYTQPVATTLLLHREKERYFDGTTVCMASDAGKAIVKVFETLLRQSKEESGGNMDVVAHRSGDALGGVRVRKKRNAETEAWMYGKSLLWRDKESVRFRLRKITLGKNLCLDCDSFRKVGTGIFNSSSSSNDMVVLNAPIDVDGCRHIEEVTRGIYDARAQRLGPGDFAVLLWWLTETDSPGRKQSRADTVVELDISGNPFTAGVVSNDTVMYGTDGGMIKTFASKVTTRLPNLKLLTVSNCGVRNGLRDPVRGHFEQTNQFAIKDNSFRRKLVHISAVDIFNTDLSHYKSKALKDFVNAHTDYIRRRMDEDLFEEIDGFYEHVVTCSFELKKRLEHVCDATRTALEIANESLIEELRYYILNSQLDNALKIGVSNEFVFKKRLQETTEILHVHRGEKEKKLGDLPTFEKKNQPVLEYVDAKHKVDADFDKWVESGECPFAHDDSHVAHEKKMTLTHVLFKYYERYIELATQDVQKSFHLVDLLAGDAHEAVRVWMEFTESEKVQMTHKSEHIIRRLPGNLIEVFAHFYEGILSKKRGTKTDPPGDLLNILPGWQQVGQQVGAQSLPATSRADDSASTSGDDINEQRVSKISRATLRGRERRDGRTLSDFIFSGLGLCLQSVSVLSYRVLHKLDLVICHAKRMHAKGMDCDVPRERIQGLPLDAHTAKVFVCLLRRAEIVENVGDIPIKALSENKLRVLSLTGQKIGPCEAGLAAHFFTCSFTRVFDREVKTNKLKKLVFPCGLSVSHGFFKGTILDFSGTRSIGRKCYQLGDADVVLLAAILACHVGKCVKTIDLTGCTLCVFGAKQMINAFKTESVPVAKKLFIGPYGTKITLETPRKRLHRKIKEAVKKAAAVELLLRQSKPLGPGEVFADAKHREIYLAKVELVRKEIRDVEARIADAQDNLKSAFVFKRAGALAVMKRFKARRTELQLQLDHFMSALSETPEDQEDEDHPALHDDYANFHDAKFDSPEVCIVAWWTSTIFAQHVRTLDLTGNTIGIDGGLAIIESLELWTSKIHTIKFGRSFECVITPGEDREQVVPAAERCKAMATHWACEQSSRPKTQHHGDVRLVFDCAAQEFGSGEAILLGWCLSRNVHKKTVQTLDISRNSIGKTGTIAILKALDKSKVTTLIFGEKASSVKIDSLATRSVWGHVRRHVGTEALDRGSANRLTDTVLRAARDLENHESTKICENRLAAKARLVKRKATSQPTTSRPSVAQLDKQCLGLMDAHIVAWWLQNTATKTLDTLKLSGNPLTGGELMKSRYGSSNMYSGLGDQYEGISSILRAAASRPTILRDGTVSLTRITSLDLSNSGLGPSSMRCFDCGSLSGLEELNLSKNPWMTGGTIYDYGHSSGVLKRNTEDRDTSGFQFLVKMLSSCPIKRLGLAQCGIGANSVTFLIENTDWATACVEYIDLTSNRFDDCKCLVRLYNNATHLRTLFGLKADDRSLNLSSISEADTRLLIADFVAAHVTAQSDVRHACRIDPRRDVKPKILSARIAKEITRAQWRRAGSWARVTAYRLKKHKGRDIAGAMRMDTECSSQPEPMSVQASHPVARSVARRQPSPPTSRESRVRKPSATGCHRSPPKYREGRLQKRKDNGNHGDVEWKDRYCVLFHENAEKYWKLLYKKKSSSERILGTLVLDESAQILSTNLDDKPSFTICLIEGKRATFGCKTQHDRDEWTTALRNVICPQSFLELTSVHSDSPTA